MTNGGGKRHDVKKENQPKETAASQQPAAAKAKEARETKRGK